MSEPPETTFCRICECLCGLEVHRERDEAGRELIQLRPDKQHVVTAGYACIKGTEQQAMYASPDRLTKPMKKVGGKHVEATWEEAIEAIGGGIERIAREHSPHAVAMYVGTAAGFSALHPVFAQGFMQGLGSRNVFSSATQDCVNKFAVSRLVYGFPFTLTFPDLDRIQCLVIVGANPAVSKWSFGQVSNPVQRLRDIRARGGRIVVVDPRRTETAKLADEHLFIRPGSDVFFYLAFLHELIAQGVDEASLRHATGWRAVCDLAQAWPPERCAAATGIDADALRGLVADYRAADGAALYCSTGVNMGGEGALAFWLQEVINLASGNLDRPGGAVVGKGIVDFPRFGVRSGQLMKPDRSRVGDFGAVNDGYPGAILADEILTEGPERVRALIVTGGNPLLTMANSGRLREALGKLDLLVTLDLFVNETGTEADWVLPCTSPLQRPDLPFVFPLLLGMQTRPYLQATRAVLPTDGQQRDEAGIYLDLAKRAGVGLFGSRLATWGLSALRGLARLLGRGDERFQEWLLELHLRLGRQGSFRRLLAQRHGKRLPDNAGGDFLGQRVYTDDGKVHLAPSELLQRAAGLEQRFAAMQAEPRLRLITKRALHTHNSWTHNLPSFVKGSRDRNHVYVHPEDAHRLGLAEGDLADVRSDTATIRLPVRLLDDLMPGVVAVPHGWGHQHAEGLGVASATAGVNVNLLAADGPGSVEPISGMAHLTGIPVVVAPAAGQQAPTWSGLPDANRSAPEAHP